jgi:uncharacterized protein
MEKVEVEGVVLNLLTNSPVVILKSGKGEVLPIVIGVFESQSILIALEEKTFPRPLTHDLIKNILDDIEVKALRLEIHSLKENVYYAYLVLKYNKKVKKTDCRPSDGIALALRLRVPIVVSEELLQKGDIIKSYEGRNFLKSNKLDRPIGKKEAENIRKIIENINTREFWKRLKNE